MFKPKEDNYGQIHNQMDREIDGWKQIQMKREKENKKARKREREGQRQGKKQIEMRLYERKANCTDYNELQTEK